MTINREILDNLWTDEVVYDENDNEIWLLEDTELTYSDLGKGYELWDMVIKDVKEDKYYKITDLTVTNDGFYELEEETEATEVYPYTVQVTKFRDKP